MRTKLRKLPAADKRVDTGPIQFGDDWPGYFIRGDEARAEAKVLRILHKEMIAAGIPDLKAGFVLEIAKRLESCQVPHA